MRRAAIFTNNTDQLCSEPGMRLFGTFSNRSDLHFTRDMDVLDSVSIERMSVGVQGRLLRGGTYIRVSVHGRVVDGSK